MVREEADARDVFGGGGGGGNKKNNGDKKTVGSMMHNYGICDTNCNLMLSMISIGLVQRVFSIKVQ